MMDTIKKRDTTHSNKKEMITYKEYLYRLDEFERIQGLGVEMVYKKNMFKIVAGVVCVVIGVVTLPLPTGSPLLIALGLSLLVNGGVDVWKIKKDIVKKIKFKRMVRGKK